jgi:hypothetical protein
MRIVIIILWILSAVRISKVTYDRFVRYYPGLRRIKGLEYAEMPSKTLVTAYWLAICSPILNIVFLWVVIYQNISASLIFCLFLFATILSYKLINWLETVKKQL